METQIQIGDYVSFETADGMDILSGYVVDIFPNTIIFQYGENSFENVPRFMAEQTTVLLVSYRETLINDILDAICA